MVTKRNKKVYSRLKTINAKVIFVENDTEYSALSHQQSADEIGVKGPQPSVRVIFVL